MLPSTLVAQHEAHYSKLLVKHRQAFADQQATMLANGSQYNIDLGSFVDSISTGADVHNMRIASGSPTANSVSFDQEQIDALLDSVDMLLDRANNFNRIPGSGAEQTGSSIKILNQSEVLHALSEVLVDRIKEELALAYFDKMASKMESVRVLQHACGSGKKPLTLCTLAELLPATQLIFRESRDHISPQAGATLKAAFMDDLEKFPAHFTSAYGMALLRVEGSNCKGELTDEDFSILLASRMVDGVAHGRPWNTILEELIHQNVESPAWRTRGALVDLSLRLLDSMKDPNGDLLIGNATDLNDAELKAYLGMLLANGRVHQDLNTLKVAVGAGANVEQMRSMFYEVVELARAIDRLIAMAQNPDRLDKGTYLLEYTNELFNFITHGESAVAHMIQTLQIKDAPAEIISSKKFREGWSAAAELTSAVANKDYGKASLQVLRVIEAALPKDSILDRDLVKLVTLAADIAQAGSGEVKAIFESAIMPVGSYRVKQATHFSASINAYPGMTGGWEQLQDSRSTKAFGGVAGPIGIALSKSRGSERQLRASNSLFLSFIDIGALLTYRFNSEDTVSANPEVSIANVLAPGLYAIHGIQEHPISYGIGVQYAPQLRGAVAGAVNLNPHDALRFGFFLTVDIPFIPLALKQRQVGELAKDVMKQEEKVAKERAASMGGPKRLKKLERSLDKKRKALAKTMEH